jgi:hypothetical protein
MPDFIGLDAAGARFAAFEANNFSPGVFDPLPATIRPQLHGRGLDGIKR